jgi:hypothetical protein
MLLHGVVFPPQLLLYAPNATALTGCTCPVCIAPSTTQVLCAHAQAGVDQRSNEDMAASMAVALEESKAGLQTANITISMLEADVRCNTWSCC